MLPLSLRRALLTLAPLLLLLVADAAALGSLTRYFPLYIDLDPPEFRLPAPPSVIITSPQVQVRTCEAAQREVVSPPAEAVQTGGGALLLDRAQAERIASRILAAYLAFDDGQRPAYYAAPRLLRAGDHLVYAVVWIPYPSRAPAPANTLVLHLPADGAGGATLYTDVTVRDPASTCRDGISLSPFYAAQATPLPVLALLCLLPLLNIAALVWMGRQVAQFGDSRALR
jgi:hypothetical protein